MTTRAFVGVAGVAASVLDVDVLDVDVLDVGAAGGGVPARDCVPVIDGVALLGAALVACAVWDAGTHAVTAASRATVSPASRLVDRARERGVVDVTSP